VLRPLLRVKCPECQIRRFFEPEALAREVRCPGCGSQFLLAPLLRRSKGGKLRSTWCFRRSGLLAEHGHKGSIPVILTMLRLENTLGDGRALFTLPSQRLSGDGINCESDLIALELDQRGRPAIVLAEVKSNRRVERRDVENLEAAATRIRESGLNCYLLFAKTGDFTVGEIRLLRELRQRHRTPEGFDLEPPPIVLAERELARYDVFHQTRDQLPERFVLNLESLARNTAHLYLEEQDAPAGE
jgi:DNA-directed RNA polymerase subunit RPC12/RpoP